MTKNPEKTIKMLTPSGINFSRKSMTDIRSRERKTPDHMSIMRYGKREAS